MKFKIYIFIFLIIFLIGFTQAKYVCGEVFSEEEMVPSWYEVDIFYVDNSSLNDTCRVSPDKFRYCCSLEGINEDWEIGDNLFAEIINSKTGYVSKKVYLNVTNSPYDIFPRIELKKLIKFLEPSLLVNISLENLTKINLNYLENSSEHIFENESINLTEGFYFEDFEINFGKNIFFAEANYSDEKFIEKKEYYLIKEINFSREIICEDCFGNKIKKDQEVEIIVSINFSEDVSGLKVYEYVPYEWEILDSEFFYSGGDYNRISKVVEGNNLIFNYSLYVPDLEEKNYEILNYLEDFLIDSSEYKIYKYVPLVVNPRKKGRSSSFYSPEKFSIVDEAHPLVSENDSLRLALYSNNYSDKGALDIIKFEDSLNLYNRSLIFIEGYFVNTNIGEIFNKTSFEISLKNSNLNDSFYENYIFYGKDTKGKIVPLTGKVVEGKYLFESNDFLKEIFVYQVKNELTFWDKIVQLYWNLFGFKTGVI